MSQRKTTHFGPSWNDLHLSHESSTLYVRIDPIRTGPGKTFLINIVRLGSFRGGSMFLVDGFALDGKKVELQGYAPARSHTACTFQIINAQAKTA